MPVGNNEHRKRVRCGALITSSATGRRCKRESITGPDELPRCDRHFDFQKRRDMSRYYREALKPALAEKIQQVMEETPGVALTAVHEELIIAREAAAEIVAMYGAAYEDNIKNGRKGDATAGVAMATVDMMSQVTKIADTAAKIDNVRAQVAGSMAMAIETILGRVTRAAYEAFGDDYRVTEFVENLKADVLATDRKSPGAGEIRAIGEVGATMLPNGEDLNELVLAMDETIP